MDYQDIPQHIIDLYNDWQDKESKVKDSARGCYSNEKRSATWGWKRFVKACSVIGLNDSRVSLCIMQEYANRISIVDEMTIFPDDYRA